MWSTINVIQNKQQCFCFFNLEQKKNKIIGTVSSFVTCNPVFLSPSHFRFPLMADIHPPPPLPLHPHNHRPRHPRRQLLNCCPFVSVAWSFFATLRERNTLHQWAIRSVFSKYISSLIEIHFKKFSIGFLSFGTHLFF